MRVQISFDDVVSIIHQYIARRLMDSARHVLRCRLTQETNVQNSFDDVASTIHQSLLRGGGPGGGARRRGAGQSGGDKTKRKLLLPRYPVSHPPRLDPRLLSYMPSVDMVSTYCHVTSHRPTF